jgi:hypothetical protein
MRDRHRAFDVVGDRLGSGIGQVIDRKNDDVIADADAAILAPVTPECGFARNHLDTSRKVKREM